MRKPIPGYMGAMTPDADEARLIFQIESWDWPLFLGVAPAILPKEQRFQGGLIYNRSLDLVGKLVEPSSQSGKTLRLSIMGFGPDVEFGPGSLEELGQLYEKEAEVGNTVFEAIAVIPAEALSTSAICLSSVWKFVHLAIRGDPVERAAITDLWFSRTV